MVPNTFFIPSHAFFSQTQVSPIIIDDFDSVLHICDECPKKTSLRSIPRPEIERQGEESFQIAAVEVPAQDLHVGRNWAIQRNKYGEARNAFFALRTQVKEGPNDDIPRAYKSDILEFIAEAKKKIDLIVYDQPAIDKMIERKSFELKPEPFEEYMQGLDREAMNFARLSSLIRDDLNKVESFVENGNCSTLEQASRIETKLEHAFVRQQLQQVLDINTNLEKANKELTKKNDVVDNLSERVRHLEEKLSHASNEAQSSLSRILGLDEMVRELLVQNNVLCENLKLSDQQIREIIAENNLLRAQLLPANQGAKKFRAEHFD